MANFNLNKVIMGGRLTVDPELKTTPSGISVTSFTIAVNRKYSGGEEQQADFFNVTAWRGTAEFISRYFKKASSICVVGSLQTRSYEKDGQKRYITEIVADEAFFVDSKGEVGGANNNTNKATNAPQNAQEVPYNPYAAPNFVPLADDEELPF